MMCSASSPSFVTQNPGGPHGIPDGSGAVCPSPDGSSLAVCGPNHTVEIWDAHAHHRRLTYYGHQDGVYRHTRGRILAMAWSPDNSRMASLSSNGSLHVWDARTGIHQRTVVPASGEAHEQPCFLCWDMDGLHLLRVHGQTQGWSL